jgi:hypothetical protein
VHLARQLGYYPVVPPNPNRLEPLEFDRVGWRFRKFPKFQGSAGRFEKLSDLGAGQSKSVCYAWDDPNVHRCMSIIERNAFKTNKGKTGDWSPGAHRRPSRSRFGARKSTAPMWDNFLKVMAYPKPYRMAIRFHTPMKLRSHRMRPKGFRKPFLAIGFTPDGIVG